MKKKIINKVLARAVDELFDFAKELGLFMGEIAFTPYGKLRINRIPRSTYYSRIYKFERQGLIKKIHKTTGNVYILSDKAKQIRKSPSQKINRKDSLSSVVIFDIPEEKRKARDSFRRYLLKNGYTKIQESVFVSPFMVFSEMLEFVKELKIIPNVTFLSAKIDRFEF